MVEVLQMVVLGLATLAMVPALAHALEMPGKLRLTKDAYFAVQSIYYPGFTVAGISEPLAIVMAVFLVMLTPMGSGDYWLSLAALLGLAGMHAVYWLFTHPVNNFWLEGTQLSPKSKRFFSMRAAAAPADWTRLRDRWEYSHVARSVLAVLSFVAVAIAVSTDGGR